MYIVFGPPCILSKSYKAKPSDLSTQDVIVSSRT